MIPSRTVLVINQYALPRSQSGGTRHIDLFSRVPGWQAVILAASRNHYTQQTYTTSDPHFHLVSVPAYSGPTLSRALGWLIFAVKATLYGLTRRGVDVIFASSPQILSPIAGAIIASVRRLPLVVEIRDLWPESLVQMGALRPGSMVHRVLLRLEKWTYNRADRLVVVTSGWEDYFSTLGVPRSKITVIPNGTEVARPCSQSERAAWRKEFGIHRRTAVYAGAHGKANALDYILEAAKVDPDTTYILIGAGPEKGRLMARRDSELLANVVFYEALPKEKLMRLLAACDVGIHCIEALPVLERGMSPNKLFDYMAAGLPVVSNAKAGLKSLIGDGEVGRLGGPGDLPLCLRDVLSATDRQRSIWGVNGQSLVANKYSRTAAAIVLEEVLNAVNADPGPPPWRPHQVAHLTTAHKVSDNRIFRKEVAGLRRRGVDICLIGPHDRDQVVDEVPVYALPQHGSRLRRMYRGPIDAYKALRRIRPMLLHIHDPELIPIALVWRSLGAGRRTVYDAHEDLQKQIASKQYLPAWSRRPVAAFGRALERAADWGMDGVVAATPSIASKYQRAIRATVQNFPWRSDFASVKSYECATPDLLSYVGGLTEERGSQQMLTALSECKHPVRLIIAGPLSDHVKGELAKCSEHIQYLGVLPAGDVPSVLSSSIAGMCLFLPHPNHLEAQPTKLFEYMAAGRPFVASDFPTWRALLGAHGCGLFVDPTSPTAIAQAIDQILGDPSVAAAMGARGRQAFLQHFCFDNEIQVLHRFTRAILAS